MPGDEGWKGTVKKRNKPEMSGQETVNTEPIQKKPELPSDVEKSRLGDMDYYSFAVAGKEVAMTVLQGVQPAIVTFSVDMTMDKGLLSGRDAIKAALKLKKVFEYDASTRPDGFKYKASAYTSDGFGQRRTDAYVKAGFSKPDRVGQGQYAVVKNGRIIPDPPKGKDK